MPQQVVAADDPATCRLEKESGVSVSTRDGARERGDGTLEPDQGDHGKVGSATLGPGVRGGSGRGGSVRAGSVRGGSVRGGSGRGEGTGGEVSASGGPGCAGPPRVRQSVTEFVDAYASSVGSLASRLDELLHSMKDVPSDEMETLVRRESRLFEEFVDEWREEFRRVLG